LEVLLPGLHAVFTQKENERIFPEKRVVKNIHTQGGGMGWIGGVRREYMREQTKEFKNTIK